MSALISADPLSGRAGRRLCAAVPRWYHADLRRVGVFGDLGQMATIRAGFASPTDEGVTLADMIHTVTSAGVASSRRVRAIYDNLDRLGAITSRSMASDRRRRPFRIGSWLEAALVDWLSIWIDAARPWLTTQPVADRETLSTVFCFFSDALRKAAFYPGITFPEVRFFLERAAGYPILMEVTGYLGDSMNEGAAMLVSRKGLARSYGLSRPHIAGLLAAAEARGWFSFPHGRQELTVARATRERLLQWPVREIAWIVLALEHRMIAVK